MSAVLQDPMMLDQETVSGVDAAQAPQPGVSLQMSLLILMCLVPASELPGAQGNNSL